MGARNPVQPVSQGFDKSHQIRLIAPCSEWQRFCRETGAYSSPVFRLVVVNTSTCNCLRCMGLSRQTKGRWRLPGCRGRAYGGSQVMASVALIWRSPARFIWRSYVFHFYPSGSGPRCPALGSTAHPPYVNRRIHLSCGCRGIYPFVLFVAILSNVVNGEQQRYTSAPTIMVRALTLATSCWFASRSQRSNSDRRKVRNSKNPSTSPSL
jgi:hypothetical protein